MNVCSVPGMLYVVETKLIKMAKASTLMEIPFLGTGADKRNINTYNVWNIDSNKCYREKNGVEQVGGKEVRNVRL